MDVKVKAARLSVASNSVLVVGKLAVGMMIGSISVVSEGIHSAIDLLAAMIALYAVRMASRPADDRHRYGHGKIENLSGTIEAVLVFLAGLWIIYESVMRLLHPEAMEDLGWGMAVMLVSALTNFFISRHLERVGKATESVALQADALHLRTDVYTSAGVVAGLVAVTLTDWVWLDSVAAILVAFLILHAAWELTHEAFMPLLDTSLPGEEEAAIKAIIEKYRGDFLEYHDFRTRKAGSERHIDLHLVFCREMTLEATHDVTDKIEATVMEEFPGAQVLIHQEPCERECTRCRRQACSGKHPPMRS